MATRSEILDQFEMLKEAAGGMTREEYADQLLAARAMLAALEALNARYNVHPTHATQIAAAIAQAKAAGIGEAK